MKVTVSRDASPVSERWDASPPGLDEEEAAWWQQFSDVEERFCWVQTPSIQRVLRGHYVRQIARAIPTNGTALEFGCGTGWLPLLLAEYGAPRVFGVDTSPTQIEKAKRCGAERGLSDRVRFQLLNGPLSDFRDLLGRVDVLIFHGVLHHLSKQEIQKIMSDFCRYFATPRTVVFIVEPVLHQQFTETAAMRRVRWIVDKMIYLPLSGQSLGIRKCSPGECEMHGKIDRRGVGVPPRGPSPKEHPFVPGELEALLSPYLELGQARPVLSFSFHVAKNLLLMRLSYPRLGAVAMGPYLQLTSCVERFLLSRFPRYGSGGHCVFELRECRVRQ